MPSTPPAPIGTNFFPRETSTPKNYESPQHQQPKLNSCDILPSIIVPEGSDRNEICDLAKRQEKAMSVYENVNNNNNNKINNIIKDNCNNNNGNNGCNNLTVNNNNSEYLMPKSFKQQQQLLDKPYAENVKTISTNGTMKSAVWLEYGCV